MGYVILLWHSLSLPLIILKKFNQEKSKSIIVRSFKHGQLMGRLPGEMKKIYISFFSRIIALCKFGLCNQDNTKSIIGKSFKTW